MRLEGRNEIAQKDICSCQLVCVGGQRMADASGHSKGVPSCLAPAKLEALTQQACLNLRTNCGQATLSGVTTSRSRCF